MRLCLYPLPPPFPLVTFRLVLLLHFLPLHLDIVQTAKSTSCTTAPLHTRPPSTRFVHGLLYFLWSHSAAAAAAAAAGMTSLATLTCLSAIYLFHTYLLYDSKDTPTLDERFTLCLFLQPPSPLYTDLWQQPRGPHERKCCSFPSTPTPVSPTSVLNISASPEYCRKRARHKARRPQQPNQRSGSTWLDYSQQAPTYLYTRHAAMNHGKFRRSSVVASIVTL